MIKKIEAFIRTEKMGAVQAALSGIGIMGMTIQDVKGRGRGAGIQMQWRTGVYSVEMMPHKQISIILSEENVDTTIEAIRRATHTGESGDGMIFVYPVEDAIRISTGQRGREAISYQGDIDTRKSQA